MCSLKSKESIFGMLFNNSSFQSLDIYLWTPDDHSNDVNTIMSSLEINTCVTELHVHLHDVYVNGIVDAIVRVIKYNTTLKHFKIKSIPFPEKIDGVRQIANALQNNTTLSDVKLYLKGKYIPGNNLHSYMATNYPDLTRDTRLSYTDCL